MDPIVLEQLHELIDACPKPLPVLANAVALLWQHLPDINWAGFYLVREDRLILGPFQGKPACVSIPCGKGVCGAAMARRETLVVPDVHRFPGHIACDSASNAEIVIPLMPEGRVAGVLDIDSPVFDRFSEEDADILTRFAEMIVRETDWSGGLL